MANTGPCPNFNHRRSNAGVRFCPMCGGVVNENVPVKKCSAEKHDKDRRNRSVYCVDCGSRLIDG